VTSTPVADSHRHLGVLLAFPFFARKSAIIKSTYLV
jgi:hypothetical protein